MLISSIQIRYIYKAIITICRARLRPHSMPLTEAEIDQKLTEYFAIKLILTSREFRTLFTQVPATAYRLLKKLVVAGKLKNISTPCNPVYVSDAGHYQTTLE